MQVILDTNILARDFKLEGTDFKILFHYLKETNNALVIPKIVIDECINRYASDHRDIQGKVRAKTAKLGRLGTQKPVEDAIEKIIDEAVQTYPEYLDSKLAEVCSRIFTQDVLNMEDFSKALIHREKPFDSEGRGAGDWIIWQAVKKLASSSGEVAFISDNNNDFGPDGCLYDELKEQIKDSPFEVHYFDSLRSFLESRLPKVDGITLAWFNEQPVHDDVLKDLVQSDAELSDQLLAALYGHASFDDAAITGIEDIDLKATKVAYAQKPEEHVVRFAIEYEFEGTVAVDYFDPLRYSLTHEYKSIDLTVEFKGHAVFEKCYDELRFLDFMAYYDINYDMGEIRSELDA